MSDEFSSFDVLGKLREFVEEDAPEGDVTSEAVIPADVSCEAAVVIKEDGVIAGMEEAVLLFKDFGVEVVDCVKDGSAVKAESVVLRCRGNARRILMLERTALNLIARMSGIATATRRIVEEVRKVNPGVKIAATRKTCPGMRYFDKKAVVIGGGYAHRMSLSDAVLIKDNHIAIAGLEEAVKRGKRHGRVEVEVSSLEDAVKAAKLGADIIMLDNMSVDEVRKAVDLVRGVNPSITIEVSGGITPDNIMDYAKLDVDIISLGWLTHSVRSLDLSLEVVRVINHG